MRMNLLVLRAPESVVVVVQMVNDKVALGVIVFYYIDSILDSFYFLDLVSRWSIMNL